MGIWSWRTLVPWQCVPLLPQVCTCSARAQKVSVPAIVCHACAMLTRGWPPRAAGFGGLRQTNAVLDPTTGVSIAGENVSMVPIN